MDKKEAKFRSFSNSKLLTVLQTMSSCEIKSLAQFLHSPYFQVRQKAIDLFEYLKPAHTRLDPSLVNKEGAFQILFPDKKFDAQKLNKIVWLLLKAIERFMIYAEMEKDHLLQSQLLMNAYNQHHLYPYFLQVAKKLNTEFEKNKKQDADSYLHTFHINKEVFFHPETSKYQPNVNSLETLCTNLDLFYASSKLRFGVEQLSRDKMLATTPNKLQTTDLEHFIEKHSSPKFEIYRKILDLLQNGHQDNIYFSLRSNLNESFTFFPESELVFLIQFLINHINILINEGQSEYQQELFELYKIGVANKLFIHNNRISDIIFINVVVSACLVKEFKYAKKFLSKNTSLLAKQVENNAIHLSKVYILFHQNAYTDAKTMLGEVDFSTIDYKIRGRSLLFRCYFKAYQEDNTYGNLFFSNADSFKKFIKRNKSIPDSKKENYLNLITILRQLANNLRLGKNRRNALKVKLLEFAQKKDVVAKNWVIQEINSF